MATVKGIEELAVVTSLACILSSSRYQGMETGLSGYDELR